MDLFMYNQNATQLNGVVKDAADVAGDVLKAVGKALSKLKSLFGKKTNDAAFLSIRNSIDDVLYENGYARPDRGGISTAPSFTAFKIKDDQVSGKNTDYTYAYARLRNFLVAMLNAYNPGLGDSYLISNPMVKMKNGYTPTDEWIETILTTIIQNPVGKNAITTDQDGNTFQKLENGITVIKDIQGKVIQLRDAAGQIINPGTPQYNQAMAQVPTQAGGTGLMLFGIAVGLGVLAWAAGRSDKKKKAA